MRRLMAVAAIVLMSVGFTTTAAAKKLPPLESACRELATAQTASDVAADMKWFDFKGFYAPVDNQPTLNVVKAGSSVPLKWSLTGYQGMDILPSGSPSSRSVACDNSLPPDELELTATPGTSGLAYDATTDRYSYVWKTERSWTGCRELVLRLADGSTHSVSFKFK